MFGNFFGSKKKKESHEVPAAPKMKRVNLAKQFTIIAEVGQGSMSKVYRAVDNQSGRVVCLKVQDAAKTSAAIGRAAQTGRPPEGVIGSQIRHLNVVKTFDFGMTTRKEHFLTMEFIDGVSMNYIRQAKASDLTAKLDLLIQTGEGLAAVHEAGFIHHDFGPKNVLVTKDDVPKIIDFGLAVPNTPTFQRPGNRTGTLQYMAPELIRRESTDERLDIFSFGVMAFEFLTNRLPYSEARDQMALMRQIMNSELIDIGQVAPHLPEELQDVIRKALTRRKEDRWRSMSQMVDALRALPIAQAS